MRNALSVLLLAALSPLFRADVLVVSPFPGPGVDASSIQEAIDLAANGDTILVQNGNYEDFVLAFKAVSILADGSNVNVISATSPVGAVPSINVRFVPVGQEVVIRGLKTSFGMRIENCSGPVWIDGVAVQGGAATGLCSGNAPGAVISRCTAVTFTDCRLVGDDGINAGFVLPGVGASITDAQVAFYDCQILGGNGFSGPGASGRGATGLLLQRDNDVLLSGTTVEGGPGGVSTTDVCNGPQSEGGAGLSFSTTDNTVYALASTAKGGAADLTALCPGQFGPAGPDIEGSGTILPLVGFARSLEANSPVRGGANLTLTAKGQPGELPYVLLSERHEPFLLPAFSGSLLVGLPLSDTLQLPTVGAGGEATLTFPVPSVGPAVGLVTYYAQAVFIDPTLTPWLGGGSTITLVDPSL